MTRGRDEAYWLAAGLTRKIRRFEKNGWPHDPEAKGRALARHIVNLFDGKCYICGRTCYSHSNPGCGVNGRKDCSMTIDHVAPERGHFADNFALCCYGCNQRKWPAYDYPRLLYGVEVAKKAQPEIHLAVCRFLKILP